MNYKLVGRIIGLVLLIEAGFMLVPVLFGLIDRQPDIVRSFVWSIAITAPVGALLLLLTKKRSQDFYASEGFVATSISWIALAVFGALPLIFSGSTDSVMDAVFEMVSGFTTTGGSIITDVEALPRAILYWRSFSHWLGGMGVLVFLLAVIPGTSKQQNSDIHLLRAESPGPEVGKLTPHIRLTATILYVIYFTLTALCFIFLLISGMPFFDSLCIALGTAGTGGFAIKADGLASYSAFSIDVVTVFMFLFGINFNLYFLMILRRFKEAIKNQELHFYLMYFALSAAAISISTRGFYGTWRENIRHTLFQVSSLLTSTGYGTVDTNLWPAFAKAVLLITLSIGACAGSTGGGFKVVRTMILAKSVRRTVRRTLHPNRTDTMWVDGRRLNEQTVSTVNGYFLCYAAIIVFSFLIISLDNQSVETNFSAVLACVNNTGPGFGMVGSLGSYHDFSVLSKIVLCIDMMLGRLEIFPILALLSRRTWDRRL